MCDTLAKLQSNNVGFPIEETRNIIEEELERSIESIFGYVDPVPVAAASMGQVVLGELKKERCFVAIKIRTPFVVENCKQDLRFLHKIFRLLPYLVILKGISPWAIWRLKLKEGVEEISRALHEELDFQFEANNQDRMRKTLKKHKGIHVPRVFKEYCTERVIVTEWIPGILMSQYLALAQENTMQAAIWCAENDIDVKKVAERLILTLLRQIFEDNRFHGDLHPGNIMLLRGNRIALIDFGACSSTEVRFLVTFQRQLEAIASGEHERAAQLVQSLTAELPAETLFITKWRHARRMADLTSSLVKVIKAWSIRSEIKGLSYQEKSINTLSDALMTMVLSRGGAMQWSWFPIQRSMSVLDGSISVLDRTINYRKIIVKYLRQAEERIPFLAPIRALMKLIRQFPELANMISRGPEGWELFLSHVRQSMLPLQGF